jgi:hypothetical protein
LPGDGSAAIIAHIRTPPPACRSARAPHRARHLQAVAAAENRRNWEEAGCAGWEEKPFDLRDIPAYNVRCRNFERFKQPVQYPHSRSYQIPLFFVLMFPRYGTRSVAFNRA